MLEKALLNQMLKQYRTMITDYGSEKITKAIADVVSEIDNPSTYTSSDLTNLTGKVIRKLRGNSQMNENKKAAPDIKVRSLYTKTYAKFAKTPKDSKEAEKKAYAEVEKKYGKDAVKELKKYHSKNEKDSLNEAAESQTKELIIHKLIDGLLNCYDVMNHPKTQAEREVSAILQKMYDDVASDPQYSLHADDDFDSICEIVVNKLPEIVAPDSSEFSEYDSFNDEEFEFNNSIKDIKRLSGTQIDEDDEEFEEEDDEYFRQQYEFSDEEEYSDDTYDYDEIEFPDDEEYDDQRYHDEIAAIKRLSAS